MHSHVFQHNRFIKFKRGRDLFSVFLLVKHDSHRKMLSLHIIIAFDTRDYDKAYNLYKIDFSR